MAGLGRLAACILESLTCLEVPAWGYGIRYDYGSFNQKIDENGVQVEVPDWWYRKGNPWEIPRQDVCYTVRFGGTTREHSGSPQSDFSKIWEGGVVVLAMAYDTPMPGYNTFNCNNLRLWRSKPTEEFDLAAYNEGDYYGAIADRQSAEEITRVLCYTDQSDAGRELRLKQEYFFCAATVRDIVNRFKQSHTASDWNNFADENIIHINDSQPALATIELLRILLDEERLPWEEAWHLTFHSCTYTNHSLMTAASEEWPVWLLKKILPRHLELIHKVNFFFIG